MIKINDNFCKLTASYLFSEVGRRISVFQGEHPDADIIRLGIGDVTLPICEAAVKAMHRAVDDLADASTFHGYGPEQGYAFLREKISEFDYRARGCDIASDEIFVSDGAKSDTGNIGDILSPTATVAVTDPVYPVYVDTNVMAGRAGVFSDGRWSGIEFLPCTVENDFVPQLPLKKPDIIYLCYPNNPTGTSLTRGQLKVWVDYALANGSLILFDAAYEAYISRDDVPHSIYEIEGAKRCAIEFRSFSKTAGFTGVRCGFTVVPKELTAVTPSGEEISLNALWNRRQCTKFNGASYVAQRAAEALYSPEGREQVRANISYYMRNAAIMRQGLTDGGFKVVGGVDSPYIWIKAPEGMGSWEFFDALLDRCNIAGTPGVGFGPSGEGYLRLTAFGSYENTLRAMVRIASLK